jgi:hypothetical protein
VGQRSSKKNMHSTDTGQLPNIRFALITLFVIAGLALILGTTARAAENGFTFEQNYIDTQYGGNGRPGWVRAGDMDDDDDLDIVAGGGYGLFIYENDGSAGGWVRYGNLDGSAAIGANGAVLLDVDADDDLDIVCAQYYSYLGWWENPGGSLSHSSWSFHRLDNTGSNYFTHDVLLADLNHDGRAQEVVFNLISGSNLKIQWFKPGANPKELWEKKIIESGRHHGNTNHAGLDVGDIDQDANADLAYSNGWYEAPDVLTGIWTWHPVTSLNGISNTLLRDMDNDDDLDLIMSAGHYGRGVYWFAAPADPKVDPWQQNDIDDTILHPEGLSVVDIDDDGDLEVITCDLDFSHWDRQVHNLYIYENLSDSTVWEKQNIAPQSYASHQLQTVDINQDGRMDIISEGCGYSIVSYYENATLTACKVDFDKDGDVDGSDIADYKWDSAGICLEVFAASFGKTDL